MGKLSVAVLVVAAFAVGVYVGRLPVTSLILGGVSSGSQINNGTSVSPTAKPSAGGTTISTAQLSDGQKKLLTTLGIDANAIVVTPAMIACAEAKVGAARIAEITAGATPSFSEGLSLLACYK